MTNISNLDTNKKVYTYCKPSKTAIDLAIKLFNKLYEYERIFSLFASLNIIGWIKGDNNETNNYFDRNKEAIPIFAKGNKNNILFRSHSDNTGLLLLNKLNQEPILLRSRNLNIPYNNNINHIIMFHLWNEPSNIYERKLFVNNNPDILLRFIIRQIKKDISIINKVCKLPTNKNKSLYYVKLWYIPSNLSYYFI